ncbi:MAG: Helicase associated domain protein [Magnetococcales bacterium]|nr:Helicase associated domain protein [Magnetococcales bacterium]
MMTPHRDRIRFLDEELFHDLTSFAELEGRILKLEDRLRRKNAFAIFAEGYLTLRFFPRTVELLPAHRLTENHHGRLSIPKNLPAVDGYLYLAESGCHPFHLLFHDDAEQPSAEVYAPFEQLLKQSYWPLLVTNLRQLPEHLLKTEGFQHVSGTQLDRLSPSWFAHFLRWLQSGQLTRRPTLPPPWMIDTIQRLRAMPPGVVTVTMPDGPEQDEFLFHLATGPGPRRLTLVLTPGAGRILDIMTHWRKLVPSVPLSSLWVVSGREIDKNEHLLPGEMDFVRCQDVASIRHFFAPRDGNPRILWATYASLPMIGQAQLGLSPIDLIVLPDSHLLAQQSRLYESVLSSSFPSCRLRLHITALPKRTNPLKMNRQEQPTTIYSLDDIGQFGAVTCLSTLSQSRDRQAVRSWKVLLIPLAGDDLPESEAFLVNTLAGCLTRYPDVRHVHVATPWGGHRRITIPDQGDFTVFSLDSKQDALAWQWTLGLFSREQRAVLSVASIPPYVRHEATCDLTVLPSHSKVDAGSWPERIGAVLRPHGESKRGLIAIGFRQGVADVSGEWTDDSYLDPVCLALQTLRDMDGDFDQAVQNARIERGRTGFWNLEPLNRWIEWVGDFSGDESLPTRFMERLLTRLTSSWQQGLGALMGYHAQWGHSDVPAGFVDDLTLATWVDGQRKAYARGWLDADQIDQLHRLHFIWDPKQAAWDHMWSMLAAFHARHGHCHVKHPDPEDGSLSQWVLRQRRDYQHRRLESGQIERLESLGFIWDVDVWEWELYFGKLVRFKSFANHAWITDPFPRDPELGAWAARQRMLRQKQSLDENRRIRLDEVGFVWDLAAAAWHQSFQQLVMFRRLYGHAQVEEGDARYPQLAVWSREQRNGRLRNQLTLDQIQKLDELGFVWDLEAAHWQKKFKQFKAFKLRYGHLRLKDGDATLLQPLVVWSEEQRQLRAKNRLDPERVNRLNALGMIWTDKQEQWEALFGRFLQFKRRHGHGDVPDRFSADPELCGWAQDQRREYRRGVMDEERRSRLTMAGFVWDPQAYYWERMLNKFAWFQRHHGEDDPTAVDPSLASLADWMASQRRMRVSGRLDEKRIGQLDALGFVWDIEAKFEREMMVALQRFMDHHGHCNIPPDFDKPQALSSWVRKLRTRKATGGLSQDVEETLTKMGFVWDPKEAAWEEMFSAIETFNRERHHCIIPEIFPEHPRLPQWVKGLRKQYKNNELDEEKIARLDRVGFVWDAKAVFWEEMFVALTGYHDRFGHCLVAESEPQYSKLAWWVAAQRKARAGGQLNERQIQRLDRLHFVWDIHAAQWLEVYRELFFFHQRHGHCLVRNDSPQNVRLSDWCSVQRKARAMGHLAPEKQERLDLLGFIWDPKEVIVEEMLMDLVRFKEKLGHCNVPVPWPENPQLSLWLQFQRQSHKKGNLDPQRKARLTDMGMDWDWEGET